MAQQLLGGNSEGFQVIGFKLANQEYGVDVNQVKSIERLQNTVPIPESPSYVKGIINLRGSVIPVIDLKTKLNIYSDLESSNNRVIIIETGKMEVGIIVDSANDVLQIKQEMMAETPLISTGGKSEYIKGIAKFGDRLIIIVDLTKILGQYELEEIIEMGTGANGSN